MAGERAEFHSSPYDTLASGTTRFLAELTAWIAGPWAAVDLSGIGWIALPTLLVLVALPAVFNAPGDKRVTGVRTPGPLRIVIEAVLIATAVISSWIVWPAWAALLVTLTAVTTIVTGWARYKWLAAGAPPVAAAG